jgi:hypothetical protein
MKLNFLYKNAKISFGPNRREIEYVSQTQNKYSTNGNVYKEKTRQSYAFRQSGKAGT